MGMDLGKSSSKPGRATPSMNVTPLVDVVLVLLIIFMVVTPLMAKQFWIHVPSKHEKDEPATPNDSQENVVVSVTKSGDILINREVVPEVDFSNRLRRVLAFKGQRTIFFDADEDADFGNAVKTMDLARGGGAETIAVVTEPLARRSQDEHSP
jgi:biopolymer transport protein ExbD/biopolymer transport protein TolR